MREFHSISRPLTIERVRWAVCTQVISTHSEVFPGRSRGMRREKPVPSVFSRRRFLYPASLPRPRHASFFPQFLRENGLKDFRLRFVAAFVPLCSFSSPLRAGLPLPSVLRKKLLSLPLALSPDPLFNLRFRFSLSGAASLLHVFPRFLVLRSLSLSPGTASEIAFL